MLNPYDAPQNDYDRFIAGIGPDDGEITAKRKWMDHRRRQEEQQPSGPAARARPRHFVPERYDGPVSWWNLLWGLLTLAAIAYGYYKLITWGDAPKPPRYVLRAETQAELQERCNKSASRVLPSQTDRDIRNARDSCLSLGPLSKAIAQ